MSVLAIDLGGSHVGCGVVSGGQVLASSSIKTDAKSLKHLLPELAAGLVENCRAAGITPAECKGIGIGFPAVLDSRSGEILTTLRKFDDLSGADLLAWCTREFHLRARMENDAKLALLGEHFAGAARKYEDVVMVTLGTGIGVAAMLQNRLLRSYMGHAGSSGGHLTVRLDGRTCTCGSIGCAEAEASTSVLQATAEAWPGFSESLLAREPVIDFAVVFRARDAKDQVACELLQHCISVWSALAVTLIHAYGPQIMLFGGGVMKRQEEILAPIRSYVEQHSWRSSRGLTRIEAAALGGNAALVGAEALFSEEYV